VRSLVFDIVRLCRGRYIRDEVSPRHRWERRVVLGVSMDENKSGRASLLVEGDCRSAMSKQHTMSAKSLVRRG
jgi:hypothetical protein